MKFSEFHFGPPMLRLLYIHNKPDLAMELYMDEVRRNFRSIGCSEKVIVVLCSRV